MENVGIKTYIQKRLKEIDDKNIADQKEVLERLTKFGRRNNLKVLLWWYTSLNSMIMEIF